MTKEIFPNCPFDKKGISTPSDVLKEFLVRLNVRELLILEEALIPHLQDLRADFGFPPPIRGD
tara:strand:+ start:157 stop:345 length:189 start_codon:yes stop_codon:yes gene_type:complete